MEAALCGHAEKLQRHTPFVLNTAEETPLFVTKKVSICAGRPQRHKDLVEAGESTIGMLACRQQLQAHKNAGCRATFAYPGDRRRFCEGALSYLVDVHSRCTSTVQRNAAVNTLVIPYCFEL